MERPLNPLVPLLLEAPTAERLSEPGAWERIREESASEGVAQVIAHAIRPHADADQRAWCDKVLTAGWARHERSLRDLDFVAGLLAEAGIEALALKGPALACRHYQPPFLRKPCLDLDFAVRTADLEKARDALFAAGYREQGSLKQASACSHHLVLRHPSKMAVELHFRLTHGTSGIPVDEFFSRAIPFQIPGGREIRVLSQADEALQLVLHVVHDRFVTLFHLYEVRRLWRAATPAMREEVMRRAADHHFSGAFALVDIAFQSLFGEAFLPPDARMPKTWLGSRLRLSLFDSFRNSVAPGTIHTARTRIKAGWLEIQITDRPLDALRLLLSKTLLAWYGLRPVKKARQIPLG